MCDSVCLRFFFFFLDQLMHAVGGPGAQAVYGIYASTLYCAASLWWTSNMPSDVSPIARQAACPRNSWHSWRVKTGSADLPHVKTTNINCFRQKRE